ncbi:ATP-binding protein [Pseudomonas sp. Marseille-QA0892]
MKLWPRSLYGRLVIILVGGMLAAQLLTSSIWYDIRHTQSLEIPARLTAARVADILITAREAPDQLDALVRAMNHPGFRVEISSGTGRAAPTGIPPPTERLIRDLLRERTGAEVALQMHTIELVDVDGQRAGLSTLLGTDTAVGHFALSVSLPDGRIARIDVRESQGWTSQAPAEVLLDVFWRVYLLRILVIVAIAMLAVHFVIRPLRQMTAAAEALGADIHRPPLDVDGPREVMAAAQAFNLMQQRLIDTFAERTRFLAAVSHDLRTPITRMRLRTEMLENENSRARFRSDLQHMEDLVSATLTFVRSGERQESREAVDIDALLDSLRADLADMDARVEIGGSASRAFAGYPQSLKRCLQNLLDNAVRYGEWAQIIVDDKPDCLRIVISDHGPGLPADQLEQVMKPFHRLEDSRNFDSGGYGLGLSIADGIARAHGGTLTLLNRQDGTGLDAVLALPHART